MTHVLGLATHRALVALYDTAAADAAVETHPEERQLLQARASFLASVTTTAWKARAPQPSIEVALLVAEDLEAWATPAGLILEFETTRPNRLVRDAFLNLADHLRAAAATA